MNEKALQDLKSYFERPISQRATAPLKNGIEIALYLDGEGPLTLAKADDKTAVLDRAPIKPDMTFWVTTHGVEELTKNQTEDIGEIGVTIIKLMLHENESYRLKAKVHIGGFDLFRHGYLGVLPLGGTTVMKFLASKGITGIGKIKDAIANLRG